jgi:hypothetical protein
MQLHVHVDVSLVFRPTVYRWVWVKVSTKVVRQRLGCLYMRATDCAC